MDVASTTCVLRRAASLYREGAVAECVGTTVTLVIVVRNLVLWLLWNFRRFRQDSRRAARLLRTLLAVGPVLALGPANAIDAESPIMAEAGRWPAFRGVGTSLTAADNLPLTWTNESGIHWTAELPGYGQSSPVVWDNRVFVTTMQGDNKETPTVVCLALDSGEKLWQREFAASQPVPVSNYVSRGAPTPAVDEDHVYAFFESGDLFVLNHDGRDVWSCSLVQKYGPIEGNHGIGSSLALTRDWVIVPMHHAGPSYLLGLNKHTGDVQWKTDYEKRVAWSSPVVCQHNGRELILMSAAGLVEGYAAASGERLWQLGGLSGNNVPSPTTDGRLVIVGSTDRGSNLALIPPEEDSGAPPSIVWKSDGASSSFGSPLVHQGDVYFVNAAGVAFCVDAQTGQKWWSRRLGDSCWASPVGAGDRVYFFTKGGATTVIRAGREWHERSRNTIPISPGSKIYGVAAVNGVLLLRTGDRLFAVGAEN